MFLKQCFVTAAVCGHVIGHGTMLGFPSVLMLHLEKPGTEMLVTKEMFSWIVAVISFSMPIGNFMSPPIMDRLGRKMAHYTVAIPIIIGWIIMVLANSFEMLLIGRILHGLSYGLNLPLRSVLIGEYTSPKYRGAFLTMISLSQGFGILFVHTIGSLISWQKTALVCMTFSFLSLCMTIYSPETPSYLAATGQYEECRKVFRWLRGENEDEELEHMIAARKIYQSSEEKAKRDELKIMTIIRKKEFYKPIVLMLHLYALIEISGAPTITAYPTLIIGSVLGKDANVKFWMVMLDAQRIVSNTAAVFVINKIKRRVVMFSVGSLSVMSHFLLAGYVYAKSQNTLPFDFMWIPVLLLNMQVFSLATGIIPLPYVIAGEVFPLEYRSIGASISVVSLSVLAFVVLKTYPSSIDKLGFPGTYTLYGAAITYCLTVAWFFLPETKGRTLQEIEDEYKGVRTKDVETLRPLAKEVET